MTALTEDATQFRVERDARLRGYTLPDHAIATMLYAMVAASRLPRTRATLMQAADTISALSDEGTGRAIACPVHARPSARSLRQ